MSYKTVDLRDKLPGDPDSNIGKQKKNPNRFIVHYSGPDYSGYDLYDQLRHGDKTVREVLSNEAVGHMAPGRFDPGFRVNGLQYHVTVWEDTVYICRNPDAKLWHCGDGTGPDSYNYTATAVHVPTTQGFPVSARTLQTLAEWIDDQRRKGGSPTRMYVKGHREVGATECPGQLMSQFITPYRNGKLSTGSPVPKEQGGGEHRDIPVDGLMSRWEFGQVAIDRLSSKQTLTYNGDKRWVYTPASKPTTDYKLPNVSRYEFVNADVGKLPDPFEVTYDGKKFGVIEKINAPKEEQTDNEIRAHLDLLAACVGSPYKAWVSGRMGEGVMAWAANALPPSGSRVRAGGFCATAGNLLLRVRKRWIFKDFDGWWYGGIAWWGSLLRDRGILRALTPELVKKDDFPPGTMFFDFYEGPALQDQGHMAIKFKGNTLFQWDTGLGANTSRTLASTYANVSRFSHFVLPGDLLTKL